MDEREMKEKKDKKSMAGIFIPAGLFVGMGIGFLVDQLIAGLFIGLGAGFTAYAVAILTMRNKK